MEGGGSMKRFIQMIMMSLLMIVGAVTKADDAASATGSHQIEDMKRAFEEITESFRQHAQELKVSKSQAEDERDQASAQRDDALAEVQSLRKERDALKTTKLKQAESLQSLQEAFEGLEKRFEDKAEALASLEAEMTVIREEKATMRRADTAHKDKVRELEKALAQSEAANARERFALAYNLGVIYKAARQFKRAEEEFKKALAMKEDDPSLHYNMGILYDDNLNNPRQARYHYERFIELAPRDPDVPNVMRWLDQL